MENLELISLKFGNLKLQELPKGWDELKQNPEGTLEFLGVAADFLEEAYETDGIQARVYLDTLTEGKQETKRISFAKYRKSYEAVNRVRVSLKQGK